MTVEIDTTTLEIKGHPRVSFEFIGLPSINTYYNMHRFARANSTAEWRFEGKEKARDALLFTNLSPINRALVVVRMFPPYEEVSDVHNVHVKAVLDGFTDAHLWEDDEWAFVPIVMYMWGGKGEQKPRQHRIRKTIIDVYELGKYIVNDEQQIMPKGRVRLDKEIK